MPSLGMAGATAAQSLRLTLHPRFCGVSSIRATLLGRKLVPLAGLEPAHLSIPHFECGASTNFTTGARGQAISPAAARMQWQVLRYDAESRNTGKSTKL